MDSKRDEVTPHRSGLRASVLGHDVPRGRVWTQPQLWDASEVILCARMVVDGPGGTFTASVEATEFWSGDRLACEVRPGLRFPTDRMVALAWIEALMVEWSNRCAPF